MNARQVDPAVFGRVAVVYGGDSAEREVSLDSGGGVLRALRSRGLDAIGIDGVPALLAAIDAGPVDRVFIMLHGRGGEDGTLQGALECLGVPYTGAGVLGSALCMDKVRSKRVWQAMGLATPAFAVIDAVSQSRVRRAPTADLRAAGGAAVDPEAAGPAQDTKPEDASCGSASYARQAPRNGDAPDLRDQVAAALSAVGLPAIVKPSREGSSVGITRVFDATGIDAAIELATRYDGELLVEQLIEGDEFTVAILGAEALPSIRIVPAGAYYDYHAKYLAEDTQYLCPGASGAAEAQMRALSRAAFDALGASGWGRVDLMRDRDGSCWLLEVNTAPGMTSHSLVPKAAAAMGIDYAELCVRILAMTLGGPE